MVTLKLLSAALFAAAVIAAPAMAREHHVARHSTDDAYSADPAPYAYAPDAAYAASGYGGYGYRCVPAPRVGSYAGDPWTNDVPCEPWVGVGY
jgi:hypothetical protein